MRMYIGMCTADYSVINTGVGTVITVRCDAYA